MKPFSIRRATPDDAEGTSTIWKQIVGERNYSAVDSPFSIEQERSYLASMSPREVMFVAESEGEIIGFQSLDLFRSLLRSMDHVGELGTFVLPEWRGKGVGHKLATHTLLFAREQGYEKLVIWVRARNTNAQQFYQSLGFRPVGRLTRQVKIGDEYDDEILMELFL